MSGDTHQSRPSGIARLSAPIALAHEQSFQIGHVAFYPATRELLFAGQTSIIEPRVMQFLVALHRAGGAVVSKDDLLQSCWEGRIVSEDAINRVVSRLRGVAEKEAGGSSASRPLPKSGIACFRRAARHWKRPSTGHLPRDRPPVSARRFLGAVRWQLQPHYWSCW